MPATPQSYRVAVIISAQAEWDAACQFFIDAAPQPSPLGDWFSMEMGLGAEAVPVLFFHGSWGKIAAAASAQYVIDRWEPDVLINLATCGGFAGTGLEPGMIVLATHTVVYDIIELMGDAQAALDFYATAIDLAWLGDDIPRDVVRATLVSADRDLFPNELPDLRDRFGAVAGDWESGAIAWVAARNDTRLLILRGVTDIVGREGSPAYGNLGAFREAAREVMWKLIDALPGWLARIL